MRHSPNKKHNSLSDTVYQNLYNRIVSGKLKAGQKITETEIAESEGISRAPVREALKRLGEDGLIRLVPRIACYVCEFTRDEIIEIFDIRKRLECLALEYAFDKFDLKKIENLKEKFRKCLKLKGASLSREELKLDSQLHRLICETSNGVNLQDMLGRLRAKIEVFRTREAQANRARIALDDHVAILNAILAGDKKKALRGLEKHIEISREYTLANLVL